MITFNGKTAGAKEWSAITGISAKTIESRLVHGWTTERALTTPPDLNLKGGKPYTKNEAEMMLNDMDYGSLPPTIQRLLKKTNSKSKKYGWVVRTHHLAAFTKWFDEEFCKTLA